jgi:hypothetical protein
MMIKRIGLAWALAGLLALAGCCSDGGGKRNHAAAAQDGATAKPWLDITYRCCAEQ